jgi:hypothetical protein
MNTSSHEDPTEKLEAMRREIARQDQTLAEAGAHLAALGRSTVAVPRSALETIEAACLVHLSPLATAAIRG